MQHNKNVIVIAVLVLALVIVGVLGASKVNSEFSALRNVSEQTIDRLRVLEEQTDILTHETEALRGTLSQEQLQRLAVIETQENLDERLDSLSSDVSGQFSELEANDSSAVVARWSQYVYKVTCDFRLPDGERVEGSGSATIEVHNGGLRFITNEHVLEEEGAYPLECELYVPGEDERFEVLGEDITVETDRDVGYGFVTEPGVVGITSIKRCAATPEIGDRVIILGYPSIGAKESITATEGIISGFDEEYYTTSAKIEQGNSGGAAIHVENDCFLGLPTLVLAGRVESLARILPINVFE